MKSARRADALRVLFLGSTLGPSTSLYYYTNLIRQGHAVYPFDPEPFRARHAWDRFLIKARKAPVGPVLKSASQQVLSLCRENQFDLVFVMAQNYLGKELLQAIREVSGFPPTLIYHSHDNNFAPGVLSPSDFAEQLKAYDYVFTTKSQNVKRYRKLGQENSHFLPSAYEPSIHHPIGPGYSIYQKQSFPVTFIGTYDRSREPYLEAVGWDNLHVWGDHWRKFKHFANWRDRIHPNAIYYFEYADVLSHSQCVLGLLREEAEDLHTQRTFEIPACGALQIAPRNDEILSFFKEGKEIVCFDSLSELKEKVAYYLKHEDKREAVARRGRERCLNGKHTYADRVREILRIASGSRKKLLKAG